MISLAAINCSSDISGTAGVKFWVEVKGKLGSAKVVHGVSAWLILKINVRLLGLFLDLFYQINCYLFNKCPFRLKLTI